jgi:hypothetical protein
MKSILRTTLAVAAVSLSFQASANSISSDKFIQCYEKAINESIQDFKEIFPNKEVCDGMTDREKIKVIDLYSETTVNSGRMYYTAADMGEVNVRDHYDRLRWETNCLEGPNNIFTAWVVGAANAVKDLSGKKTFTNLQIVEDAIGKMIGRPMWTENGSDKFSDHTFDYCLDTEEDNQVE